MGAVQSGANNAGLAARRQARLRKGDDHDGMPVAYDIGGIPKDFSGDQEAVWAKFPPFPSLPSRWIDTNFQATGESQLVDDNIDAGSYHFLSILEIGHVRTVTTFIDFQGSSALDSQLSIIPGSVLPGAQLPLDQLDSVDMDEFIPNFFSLGVVDLTPTAITLNFPFSEDAPAVSREIMPAEFRSIVLSEAADDARRIRMSLQWEVAPFTRFTLAITDLTSASNDQLSPIKIYYTYSM